MGWVAIRLGGNGVVMGLAWWVMLAIGGDGRTGERTARGRREYKIER